MHPDLEAAARLIRDAVTTVDPAVGDRRTPEGKWSAGEIVEHLALAFEGTTKGLRRCLASGQPFAKPASLKARLARTLILEIGYFPEGRPAPAHVIPAGIGLREATDRALRALEEMDVTLNEAASAFGGDTVKVLGHPILGPFSPRDWRRFHRVHTRHHTRQIERRRVA